MKKAKAPTGGTAAPAPPGVDFEASMAELEAIVERLEQGDLPLEESLRQFERGVALTRACQGALKQAEQRVAVLLRKPGQEPEVADFEPDTDED
jgi:exodeoxyribonuclease VII small subunit